MNVQLMSRLGAGPMNSLTLIDAVIARTNLSSGASDKETVERVGVWLDHLANSLVADVKLLRQIDNELWSGDANADRILFQLVYAEFEQWTKQAEVVLKRIDWLQRRGRKVAQADDLLDYHGRTLARLQVTLDDEDEVDAEFNRGEVLTVEEVRNELRALARAKSAGGVGGTGPVATGGDTGRDRVAG